MTSYVMCNKKKLGIRKSDIECLKKSVEDRKLEYFKSELLKILDKKEKEESGEEVSKAFIVQELYKSMTDPLYMAKGGKVGVVGEIRTWNGKKYKKMPNKKWVRIYDTHDKHTEISIARLKGKVRNAQSVDELFEIVMNNTHRFSDENGKPLDIVLELKKEVDAKKKALNAGKPSTKEQIKKEQKEENKTTNAYGFTEQEVKDLNYLFNQFSNHSTRKLNWKAFNEQLNLSTRAGSKILHKITKKLCKDNGLTLSERASLPANAIHDAIDNLFMNYIEPKKKTITLPKVNMIKKGESEWGTVFEMKNGSPLEAARFLLKNKDGLVENAFTGKNKKGNSFNVGMCWGHERFGLQKIIEKHIIFQKDFDSLEEMTNTIQAILENGVEKFKNKNKIQIDNGKYRLILDKSETGKLVLTVFDNSKMDYEKVRSEEEQELKRKELDFVSQNSLAQNGTPLSATASKDNIAQDYTVVNKKDKENPAVKKSFASIVNELKKSYFDNIGA